MPDSFAGPCDGRSRSAWLAKGGTPDLGSGPVKGIHKQLII